MTTQNINFAPAESTETWDSGIEIQLIVFYQGSDDDEIFTFFSLSDLLAFREQYPEGGSTTYSYKLSDSMNTKGWACESNELSAFVQRANEYLARGVKHQGLNTPYKRTDGFIKNVESAHPFDVIRADVVLERMNAKAHFGCGLHYEIYQYNLISSAMKYLERLPERDRPTFEKAAENIGLKLTESELVQCANAYCDLTNELFEDY